MRVHYSGSVCKSCQAASEAETEAAMRQDILRPVDTTPGAQYHCMDICAYTAPNPYQGGGGTSIGVNPSGAIRGKG